MNEHINTDHCTPEDIRILASDPESLEKSFNHNLIYHLGRFLGCDPYYLYEALAITIRERVIPGWRNTRLEETKPGTRRASYLSLEFLIGRSLGNHLLNLGIRNETEQAMFNITEEFENLLEMETDAGLGNGGLGRLAACFMDSCATLRLPVTGYGIRYEYGMFRQDIVDGCQIEEPDHWLQNDNPWELERQEYAQFVHFGGHTIRQIDHYGKEIVHWVDTHDVLAIPYDVPVSGYQNNAVNTLRLWKAAATEEFNLGEFNAGSYTEAVASKTAAEDITMVLYPNDSSENGKELRLRQQYFLASASLKDVFRLWDETEGPEYSHFAEQNVFQLNDTHPSIAVAELMRILLDEKYMGWDEAWSITQKTMAYTNHTLLPEALEKWPVRLFEKLLPRLLEIIYEINAQFLHEVAMRWPGDVKRQRRMSIIEENDEKMIRMAYLAIVGSFSVNGVAELHTKLLKQELFRDFYTMWPSKFNNKTNGVTPRRWIAHANPGLTELVTEKIGPDWIADLSQLSQLKKFINPEQKDFQKRWFKIKQDNKKRLAKLVKKECQVEFNVNSLFDVQVKRIHEYKRQLMNALHVIHLYNRIKRGDTKDWTNRCVLFGGKAAPGYAMAKSIIKLVNNIAQVVNNDPDVGDKLKLAFFPNYRVSTMEIIAPGTDLSEQISTAGKEASGTGNMKFMMNGAITIGTYDGANIEILDAVGEENFFLFGLRANEVAELHNHYNPQSFIDSDPDLASVMQLLQTGHFNAYEPGIFDDLIAALKNPYDPWMTLADFRGYIDAQQLVGEAYRDQDRWLQMSILNSACSGFFSTDRTISNYNRDIWKLEPVQV